jgi:hypothetical protein
MLDQKRIWYAVVPVVLLVLVLGMAFGMVWHQHAHSSPDACLLCHLAISPSVVGICACVLVSTGAGPEIQHIYFISRSVQRQIPARAPPA